MVTDSLHCWLPLPARPGWVTVLSTYQLLGWPSMSSRYCTSNDPLATLQRLPTAVATLTLDPIAAVLGASTSDGSKSGWSGTAAVMVMVLESDSALLLSLASAMALLGST